MKLLQKFKLNFLLFALVIIFGLTESAFFIWQSVNLVYKIESARHQTVTVAVPVTLPVILPENPAPVEEEPAEEEEEPVDENYLPPSYSSSFQWGATMRPNAYAGYTKESWQAQIDKAKELGIGWARINYVYSQPMTFNKEVVDALKANGLNVMLVVEHNPSLGTGNMYGDGLSDGKEIGSELGGMVDYVQMGNEGGAQSIKSGTLEGIRTSDYDEGEYEIVRDYTKGLSEGLDQTASNIRRIVTISWMHTGYLDKLTDDGVLFDMIGVDWYSWMGNFGSKGIGGGRTLYGKLKSFGKPLIFVEVNAWPQGDEVNEQAQANFISSVGSWAWNNRSFVKGFYAYELVDNISASGLYKYFGLIKAELEDRRGSMGANRPAFDAYRDLIN